MILLLLFSFFAGVVTILSPCILPVLPIILTGAVPGNKKKPFGIVLGFVLTFTLATLFFSQLVRLLGLPVDTLRYAAVIIISLLGFTLLVPKVQTIFEMLFSRLSQLMPQTQNTTGFGGGLLTGMSLGAIWTPCVGPIIAAVITLSAVQSVTSSTFLITLAYSIGTAIPMFAIMAGGQNIIQKTKLNQKTAIIQKIFGVIMILTAFGLYLGVERKFQAYILEVFPNYGAGLTRFENFKPVLNEIEQLSNPDGTSLETNTNQNLNDYPTAPEIIPGGQWFNSEPLKIEDLRGKVVLIDFWTYTCINCIRTLPYLQSWHEKYADSGFVLIGVHTPEFEFEKSPRNLQNAINDYGLTYPIIQDNDYATWRAYNNRYWPAKYLIDKDGKIRYTHFGEGKYDETEKQIQALLKEAGQEANEEIANPDYEIYSRTPELYLGTARMESPLTHLEFEGDWIYGPEYSNPQKGAKLILNFEAKEVFLVMRTKDGETGEIYLKLDGESMLVYENLGDDEAALCTESVPPSCIIYINADRLYKLINLKEPGEYQLEIQFNTDNIEVYAFTFG